MSRLGAGLTEADLLDLNGGKLRVYRLVKDGEWHSAVEIRLAAGEHGEEASEGLRRLRELKGFFAIEKRRSEDGARLYEYRAVIRTQPDVQESLFQIDSKYYIH